MECLSPRQSKIKIYRKASVQMFEKFKRQCQVTSVNRRVVSLFDLFRKTSGVPVCVGVYVAVFSGDCVCGRDSSSDGHHGHGCALSLVCQQQRRHRPILVRHTV